MNRNFSIKGEVLCGRLVFEVLETERREGLSVGEGTRTTQGGPLEGMIERQRDERGLESCTCFWWGVESVWILLGLERSATAERHGLCHGLHSKKSFSLCNAAAST